MNTSNTTKTVTRYAATHIGHDGMRTLTGPNQGRCFSDTREDAEKRLSAVMTNNTPELLADVYGPQSIGTFRVIPITCYENGDACGIYFPEETDAELKARQAREHAEKYTAAVRYFQQWGFDFRQTLEKVLPELPEKLAADRHLNNIPLHYWDRKGAVMDGRTVKAAAGSNSLSARVCILKQAAKMIVDGTL